MSWLTPLGFLGLAGLIALIIIYIIKPNYQLKIISSTFIWKLSLKLRKKKIPINKLRNILIFICQLLIITSTSLMLAQPFIAAEKEEQTVERIAIIDASASMLTKLGVESRFERAVADVRNMAQETLAQGGKVSIILAGETSSYLVRDITAELGGATAINMALDSLTVPGKPTACTYGSADIKGAIELADQITSKNTGVEVLLYTDTQYIDHGEVKIMDVTDPMEWNAAILDVRATKDDGYMRVEIDVASYGGRDSDIRVFCDITHLTEEGEEETLNLISNARCKSGDITTLVFGNYTDGENPADNFADKITIDNFVSISAYIQESDSFSYDNTFYLYGGKKPVLKVQYYSALPNSYFSSSMVVMQNLLKDWDIKFDEPKPEETPATEGYDIYIFEHVVPKTIPKDGLLILSNPKDVPLQLGIRLSSEKNTKGATFEAADSHPLMHGINPSNIEVTRFSAITSYDGYIPLMTCDNSPVVMLRDDPDEKILVMSFSLNYSNLPILADFPLLMSNIFTYFAPPTITEFVFDINDTVSLNARSERLNIVGPSVNSTITSFPSSIKLTTPGVYTLTQTPLSGDEIVETFFVKVAASESNINTVEDTLDKPYFMKAEEIENHDLLLYFALAMVALLFVEWWLNSREQF